MGAEEDPYGPLWITRLTRYSRIDKFTEKARINDFVRRAGNSWPAKLVGVSRLVAEDGNPQVGPYVFVLFITFIDIGILSTISYINGKQNHALEIPTSYLIPLGLLFGVWAIRMFARNVVMDSYNNQFDSPDAQSYDFGKYSKRILTPIVDKFKISDTQSYDIRNSYFKHIIFSILLILNFFNLFVFGEWSAFLQKHGFVIAVIKYWIVASVIYFSIIAELSGMIAASFVSIPRYFVKNNYELSFDDPHDVGGLKTVGDLIKTAFYMYAIGLTLIVLFIYAAPLFQDHPYNPFERYKVAQFVIAWLAGIAFLLYGTIKLHLYMESQKEEKIDDIKDDIEDLGNSEQAIPDEVDDEQTKTEIQLKYMQLEQVKATRTLPFTAATQERVLFTAAAPLVLERLLNFITI